MTVTVTFYADFIDTDLTVINADELKLALVASAYTFSAAHGSFASDIAPNETTGTGYAEIDYVTLVRASGASGVTDYTFAGPPTFAAMTTTDYRYVVLYDHVTDKPILCIDTGATNSLTTQGLVIAGTVFTTTF